MPAPFYKYLLRLFFGCVIVALSLHSTAQNSQADSIKNLISRAKSDTAKIRMLVELSNICEEHEIIGYCQKILEISNSLHHVKDKLTQNFIQSSVAAAYNNIGYAHLNEGRIPEALSEYKKALRIRSQLHDFKGMAESHINIGYIYEQKGMIAKAIENYEAGLNMNEKAGDKRGMAFALNNLGFINQNQGYLDKAIELYNRSLQYREELKDDFGIAQSLTNVGAIYKLQKKYDKALACHQKALTLQEKIGDKSGVSNSLNNMGFIYQQQKFFPLALSYFEKCLTIRKELGEKKGISTTLVNIGNIYLEQGQTAKAEKYGNESMNLAGELGFPGRIRDAALLLKNCYKRIGDYKKAFEMDELFIVMQDSLNNEETRKQSAKQQLKYEYEKKAAADSAVHEEAGKLLRAQIVNKELEIKQSNLIKVILYGGVLILIILSVFVITRLRSSQKQRTIIEKQKSETEKQKNIIEEKQQEILASINYAKRIQDAMLRHEDLIANYFRDYFILFKPRDIVSGDFYWFAEKEGKLFFALADCTGHGVPGGFMSMLGISLLNEIILEKNMNQPCEILDTMKLKLIQSLRQSDNIGENKDGMDMVLGVLDKKNLKIEFSCANNPLWLIRNGQLREFHPDKQPVGYFAGNTQHFHHHELLLLPGDTIYLITDGYADQFGGTKGKKFKYKPLKEALLVHSDRSCTEQKNNLELVLDNWKNHPGPDGNNISYEQVDDISIVALKV